MIPFDIFVIGLDEEAPPPFATPTLRAVWHGLRGDWNPAHDIAQACEDQDGAWVHAWLYRIEGDQGNAEYRYRRAHHEPRHDDARDEGLEIARALIHSMTAN